MSIAEKASEISGNNATIAENLQKVYDAGLKAGLAQDPDYAEGYKDGVESGTLWESLLNGDIAVGKAREADHATEADHSTNADHATEADHAVNADRATNADHAATATTAQNIANVLPIENGGTGATTAEEALANLGLNHFSNIEVGHYIGHYIGTRTYGKDCPNSLTFPFAPKLVIIVGEHGRNQFVLVNGVKYSASYYKESGSTDILAHMLYVTWDGYTVSWYYDTLVYDRDEEGNPIHTGYQSNYQLNGGYYLETTHIDEETGEEWTEVKYYHETYHYIAIA